MKWIKYLILSVCMYESVCCGKTLEEFVSALEEKPHFKQASISIYIAHENGEEILNYHGEKSLIPNSIVKLLTTAAALKILGEDFRFHTQLYTSKPVIENRIEGDLIIMGDGDPSLGDAYKEQLGAWVDALKQHDITAITGSVIGDASCFERALSPSSWSWEDVGNYYGAGACGLNFHENTYRLVFRLGQQLGEATRIESIEPSLPSTTLFNEVVSGPQGSGDQASIFGGEFSQIQHVRGTVPLDHPTFTIKGSIPDPAECCAEQLKEMLESRGIIVRGGACSSFEQRKDADRYILHHIYSPKLSELIYTANQRSMNLYCESFLKKMGGGTHQGGLKVIKEYLKELHLSLEGFRIVDGSGLSSKNLVTARGMVEFLCKVHKEPYFKVLLRSLPSNGCEGNTRLSTRISSSVLAGRVRAKSGFSSQGESLVGLITTRSGKELTFCIIVNHFLGPNVLFRKEMESLLELLLVY